MKSSYVDDYIAKSQDFARPILKHIRKLVHETVPGVDEVKKWSFPHFDYKGEMMCSMAAFKEHCAFGFWKTSLMKDTHKILDGEKAMGHFGRITSLKDLPSDKILKEYIKQAAKLNEDGVKVTKPKKSPKQELEAPDYFKKALSKNKDAKKHFESFQPSAKRDYIEWLVEAKTEATRGKRMATALEWIAEGKKRHWKYENC